MKHRISFLTLIALLVTCCAVLAQTGQVIVPRFDAPFLFAYLSWQNKVKVEGGHAILRGDGVTGLGGGGFNVNLDLSRFAPDNSPALRLKAGAGNTIKTLKLLLLDTQQKSATWEFTLPAPGGDFVLVTPRDGASLNVPNSIEKGMPGLAHIIQYQFIGDWTPGAVDVEVASIEVVPPDNAIKAQQADLAQRQEQERQKVQAAHDALRRQYGKRNPNSPNVEHVAPVAIDVIAVEIQAGHVLPGSLVHYVPQPGDTKDEKKNAQGQIETVLLNRGGKTLGWLIGPNREWLTTYEHATGDPLLEFMADDLSNYTISSRDDAAFSTPVKPISLGRKSKPNDWASGSDEFAIRHIIYLRLPHPLAPGKHYEISLGDLNTRQASVPLVADATMVRSEAVHVNQIGYRPDDPAKRAFVSCWMGTGGTLKLPATLNFMLVNDNTNAVVFRGRSERLWPADKIEAMQREVNFNGTDVMRLDFSSFKTPGRYRVAVEGVGCSYPFEIGNDTWRHAFIIQMRGLLNQRSGMALGPPYTSFVKPRDMHPADGYKVTKTKYRWVEKGGEAWSDIVAGDTGVPVSQGWGGYHDAGDWNPRRVSHMRVTLASLEAFELFPRYFASVKLNIPPVQGVPDVLAEAIWEFECFHRLQQPDGGVPYGMESKGDPLTGEVSWLNSYQSYVFSADYANSWYYAAVGAQLAYLLQPYDAKRATTYRDSAIRAFRFAEADWARDTAAGLTQKRDSWQIMDNRNLAALELYRLTRDPKYHTLFLQDTALKDDKPELFAWGKHVQRDHAFLYARLPAALGDATLKKKAVAGIRALAERALIYADNNAFNLTTPDKGKPQFIGFYSTPDATDLIHAHFLTGEAKYLAGAVQATQFQSGCNPGNLVYTSGLGANPIRHPFHLDSRRTGQPAPEGLTPYGNIDFARWHDNGITWPITWFLSKNTTPDPYAWPTHEAYWDVGHWPMLEEYTVDAWAPNVAVWGYLAGRPQSR